jgi:chemosensory pili system protein ChpA (sensor histidine kinase/response regulator)
VLQDVLDWANRIDREGIPSGDAVTAGPERTVTTAGEAGPVSDSEPVPSVSAQSSEAMVRVPASLVDELLRLVGETIISTGQVRERLQRLLRQNRAIREQNSVFLQLATELEELVDLRGAAAGFGAAHADDEFDPLEFEHYGELHTVSRRLIEAATDTRELSVEVQSELSNLGELVEVQNRLHEQSQNAVMRTRMVPVATVVSRLQRSVRQAARLLDKPVVLTVTGADTMIDSNILNELVDPLMHMLRNAVDHGIESPDRRAAAGKATEGRIELAFSQEGNQVVVRCRDDGAGLDLVAVRRTAQSRGLLAGDQVMSDEELGRLILAPGFSTRTESTQVSGRGVGMDVVYSRVLQLKGGLNLLAVPGKGLEIELRLPAVLISTHALLVRSRARIFAVSSYGVQDIRYVLAEQVQRVGGESFFRNDQELFPLVDLDGLLNLSGERRADDRLGGFPVILVRGDSGAVHAVRVQEIIDSCSLVVKNLGPYVPKPHGVVGATILGDGSVAAVIDVPELMRKPARQSAAPDRGDAQFAADPYAASPQHRLTALVVDDSLSARRATAQFMKDAGFEVRSAIDGLEAVSILAKWKPSILLVDMEMPRMNGLELTAHVRARPETAKIPVIMITSRSTEKHRRQAEVAGVNVYLTKPFGDDQLLQHITELTAA